MKTTNKFLALALMAVAMAFASCSKDDDCTINNAPTQQEIETKIIGKWKSLVEDNEDVLTDRRSVRTYLADGTTYISFSRKFQNLGFQWAKMYLMNYKIKDDVLTIDDRSSGKSYQFEITGIGDDFVNYLGIQPTSDVMKTVRVTADYSQDIIGMWEGVEVTGYETYGNAEHRIMYKADGTYTYFNKVDGEWQPLADMIDEYNVDGDWLATRWQNQGSNVMNYEWWDIDYIKDGTMKWSALREKEDGTRFTTTFTWKKIIE